MTIRCHVLAKLSPSYSYVGRFQVQDGVTVYSVSQAAKNLASQYHNWDPETARVRIKLYQVLSNPTFRNRL